MRGRKVDKRIFCEVVKPKKTDSIYAKIYLRKVSVPFLMFFYKMKVSPNFVTFLSLLVGIIGSTFFISTNIKFWLLGWLILHFYPILDSVDGELAQLLNKKTKFGHFFDSFCHPLINKLILVFFTIGLFRLSQEILVLLIGVSAVILYSTLSYSNCLIRIIFNKTKGTKIGLKRNTSVFMSFLSDAHAFLYIGILSTLMDYIFKSILFRLLFLIGVCIFSIISLYRKIVAFKNI